MKTSKSARQGGSAVLVVCLRALLCSQPARAEQETDPCVTQANTVEINTCTKRRLDEAEKDLNSTYKAVIAALERPDGLGREQTAIKKVLVESQRDWVAFREKNCDAVLMLNADGTIRTYRYLSCKQQLAEERTKQLRLWFLPQ